MLAVSRIGAEPMTQFANPAKGPSMFVLALDLIAQPICVARPKVAPAERQAEARGGSNADT